MKRFHVHFMLTEILTGDEIATATITLNAHDDQAAQKNAWNLFDPAFVSADTTEIEEAE